MSTAIEVINRSLREIGVLAQNQTATAFQGQQALADLKAMIASWELDGITMGDGSNLTSTTTELPYPENHTDAIMYNLAVRMAPKFGRQLKETTVFLARKGYTALQATYGSLIDMEIDGALKTRRPTSGGDGVY
jgi:P22 tail accessory factor